LRGKYLHQVEQLTGITSHSYVPDLWEYIPAIEWRLSFSVQEKWLIISLNHTQLLCYAFLKVLLKEVINKTPIFLSPNVSVFTKQDHPLLNKSRSRLVNSVLSRDVNLSSNILLSSMKNMLMSKPILSLGFRFPDIYGNMNLLYKFVEDITCLGVTSEMHPNRIFYQF
jgi:hypothetical protein